jgi:hypothetical protein
MEKEIQKNKSSKTRQLYSKATKEEKSKNRRISSTNFSLRILNCIVRESRLGLFQTIVNVSLQRVSFISTSFFLCTLDQRGGD